MTIHGSMFNVTDVENAADDPFNFSVGRLRVVVAESGPDTIKVNDEELNVWKVVLRDPTDDPDSFRKQDVLFFLDGDDKQRAQTNTNIKRMLKGMEIPVNQWEQISADPGKLVGKHCIVEIAKTKKDRNFVKDWFGDKGAPVGQSSSVSVDKSASYAAAASMIGDL